MLLLSVLLPGCAANTPSATITPTAVPEFDGERAFEHVETQVAFGPRTAGSSAHANTVDWIVKSLAAVGWPAEVQSAGDAGEIQNIVARRGEGHPWIIVGAHYDTRLVADRDPNPELRSQPVPGANDGASGVAVLLELARVLPSDLKKQIWLVFFDAEDNGNIPGLGTDWIMGSRAFALGMSSLPPAEQPQAVVILDMIGDADLNLHYEKNSNLGLSQQIWDVAASLGYQDLFIPSSKYTIIDDHLPFIELGIPAVDVIDFDYPYWHTTLDTPDKVSAQSLKAVGDTMYTWLTDH